MIAAANETEKDVCCPSNAKNALSVEVEAIIMPLLETLKEKSADPLQTTLLIKLLETNIQHLVKAYGNASSLVVAYQCLTPVERLVAAMVRQGLPSKEIAMALTISPGTVSIHRKHIRKKLGLDSRVTNLQSYLMSLS
jgi:DNA-binding CsgD family transcriptional regulator